MRGGCAIEIKLTAEECTALLSLRELHEELGILKDGLRELKLLAISVSSPNMDGMPKAQGSTGDAYAQTMARIEKQEQAIRRAERKIKGEQAKTRRCLAGAGGSFRLFCASYYIGGEPFEVAQAASGVQRSRCYDYARTVKQIAGKEE